MLDLELGRCQLSKLYAYRVREEWVEGMEIQ